jgi:glycerol-3-phosphate O-acyltransferase/dihydroxyacetone phosphate acyltransferase
MVWADNLPQDLIDLKNKLDDYQKTLDDWGLKDYQINTDLEIDYSKLLYTFLHALFVMTLASIPSIVLNAPVGLLARLYANREV